LRMIPHTSTELKIMPWNREIGSCFACFKVCISNLQILFVRMKKDVYTRIGITTHLYESFPSSLIRQGLSESLSSSVMFPPSMDISTSIR